MKIFISKLQDHCQKLLSFVIDIEDGNKTHRSPHIGQQ